MSTMWCRNYLKKLLQPRRNKGIEEKERADHVHWNRLSREILQQIVDKLNSCDCLRMSMVCKSWKSVQSISRVPWLILPHEYIQNNNSLSFFDLCEGQVYTISLPTAAWFCGSSKGWILMLQLKCGPGQSHPIIFLFNPISGVQLPLPSLKKNPSFQTFLRFPLHIANFVNKIELSSWVDASDCIIAATFFDGSVLALCTPQGESWTIFQGIDPEVYSCADILFCHGILHALIYSKNWQPEPVSFATHNLMVGGHDVIVKLIPADPTLSRRRIPQRVDWINPEDEDETKLVDWIPEGENKLVWRTRDTGFRAYLVESEGEVLIVHKMMNILNTQIDAADEDHGNKLSYPQLLRFEVLKINGDRSRSLGEQVLFVTSTSSLSVAARDSNGLKKNSILFLDDYVYGIGNRYSILSRESGVFYLENGRIERSVPTINNSNYSPMSWFPLVNNCA